MDANNRIALKTWEEWHSDIPGELIPTISPAFEMGFDIGMKYRESNISAPVGRMVMGNRRG